MKKIEHLIENRIAQNVILWVLLYLIFLTSVQSNERFLTAFYMILFLSPVVYVTNLVVLPFLKKSKILFFSLFFISTTLFTFVLFFIINYFTKDDFKIIKLMNFFGLMLLTTIFSLSIKLARDSFEKKHKDREAELKLLKGQLNPHFLFNTLNNLYGLSVLKSDKLPNLMLKLSDLLRYSLYETQEKLVPLENEIKYLENYISLEKIRLEDKTEIKFTKSGDFTDKKIAPMLLIVYVENTFKHLDLTNQNSKVIIKITLNDKKLIFNCENTFDIHANNNLEEGKSGIGLVNAEKRLDIIYPNKHQLKIIKGDEKFLVMLDLDL